jgi:hypothetical protein
MREFLIVLAFVAVVFILLVALLVWLSRIGLRALDNVEGDPWH